MRISDISLALLAVAVDEAVAGPRRHAPHLHSRRDADVALLDA